MNRSCSTQTKKNALSSPGKSDSDTMNRLCATQTKKKEKQFFHQGNQNPIRLKFNSDLKKEEEEEEKALFSTRELRFDTQT